VAQHAATEAGIINNQLEHCPALACVDFIDTIPLALATAEVSVDL
jgi:DNA polymerase-3 subunit epsilon